MQKEVHSFKWKSQNTLFKYKLTIYEGSINLTVSSDFIIQTIQPYEQITMIYVLQWPAATKFHCYPQFVAPKKS